MARINIEDDIHKDKRFIKLIIALDGDLDRAIGALVRAWTLGQKHWKNNKSRIPLREWKDQEINPAIIEVGLAKIIDGSVHVCGAEEQFAWLNQRVLAGAKGGRARPSKINNLAASGGKRSLDPAKPLTPTPTLSPTLSLFPSPPQTPEENKTISRKSKISGPSGVKVWESYREAYKTRYGVEPLRNAMVNKFCQTVVKSVGEEDGINLVKFYLSHNEAFYLKVTHSLNILIRDLQPLMTQMKRGKKFTNNDIRQFEKSQHYRDQMDRIDKGEL